MMTTVFISYLVILIFIVAWSVRRTKTNDDFVIGGKKLSGLPLALSERATGESAWLLLGLTGHAYAEGWSSIWVAIGCVSGVLMIWFFLAKPLQLVTDKLGALTLSGLFIKRFPGHEKPISRITSLVVIFFFMLYLASQFSGAGIIFNDSFGIDPFLGMMLGALLVTVYTMLGGFITVVSTDAFQAILMVITCVVLPVVALFYAVENNIIVFKTIEETSNHVIGNQGIFSFLLIINGLSWALGYTGQPQLLTRLMAMRNSREVRIGKIVAVFWTILAYSGAFLIGLIGYQLAKHGLLGDVSEKLSKDAEKILPTMVMVLVNPLLAGILLSGAVSAMMSTASSQLMVASTAITEDFLENHGKRKITQSRKLWLNKLLIVVVGGVAILFAITMKETVYNLVSYAWSGIGASFGPAVVLLLFWRKFSVAGLYGSLIGGSLSAIFWKMFLSESTGISERLVSYILAFALAILLSLFYPSQKKNII